MKKFTGNWPYFMKVLFSWGNPGNCADCFYLFHPVFYLSGFRFFAAAGKCNYGGAGICIHGERICTAAGRLRRSRRKLRLVLQELFSGWNHYSRHSRVAYNLLLPEFSRWLYLHLSGGQNAKAHTFRCQKSRRGKGKRTE